MHSSSPLTARQTFSRCVTHLHRASLYAQHCVMLRDSSVCLSVCDTRGLSRNGLILLMFSPSVLYVCDIKFCAEIPTTS